MTARIRFSGPCRYRMLSLASLFRGVAAAGWRRTLKGPRRPGWNWAVELGTEVLKRQLAAAFEMGDVNQARRYLDALVLESPAVSQISITPVRQETFAGCWLAPKHAQPQATMLYLHGGGYSFYPKSYLSLMALLTLAANSKTFALDYRLAPEHRFPAQLDDALHAYRWLLGSGVDPAALVVAGDSAGGNLALALLLAARDTKLPLPALAIAFSPPTDFAPDQPSGQEKAAFDWIDQRMAVSWADWFCAEAERRNPLVSPVRANLRGIPPIYIQAGRAEILYDSIRAFEEAAKRQGATVCLESWADMNHDFQMFGNEAPQSVEALRRFGEVVREHLGRQTGSFDGKA